MVQVNVNITVIIRVKIGEIIIVLSPFLRATSEKIVAVNHTYFIINVLNKVQIKIEIRGTITRKINVKKPYCKENLHHKIMNIITHSIQKKVETDTQKNKVEIGFQLNIGEFDDIIDQKMDEKIKVLDKNFIYYTDLTKS